MAYFSKIEKLTALLGLIFFISTQAHSEVENTKDIPSLPEAAASNTVEIPAEESVPAVVQNPTHENPGYFWDNDQNRGVASTFNAVEFVGYFRMRYVPVLYNGHLKTSIPSKGGTSSVPPNLDSSKSDSDPNSSQNKYTANMRLRLEPTLNISQSVRVKSTVDVFDNLVLGSTPNYLDGHRNPSSPVSALSMSQSTPIAGINSLTGSINVKRLWGEVESPVGEFRFGRMPMHWGLGILYNSGDEITSDYGDQIDGLSFASRFFDTYVNGSYSIAYTGPVGRGGGNLKPDHTYALYTPGEEGARYSLEPRDMTHVLMLSVLRRDSTFIAARKKEEGRAIFNYGIFTSYRRQNLDSQFQDISERSRKDLAINIVKRDAHIGLGSLWSALTYKTFHLEAEAAGIWGKYTIGDKPVDHLASNDGGTPLEKRSAWLLQGGIALQSKYGFLEDRLQLGLDGGIASSQDSPGFGLREGVKDSPKEGDADGRKLSSTSGYNTNFKFHPGYTVDLLMYREVLGQVSGSYYFKPHLSYFFSRNFGVRGDVITSLAGSKKSTPGDSNWLGVELDASTFLKTQNGFYFSLAYGVLFPLQGLSHRRSESITSQEFRTFGNSQTAQTLQFYFGLLF